MKKLLEKNMKIIGATMLLFLTSVPIMAQAATDRITVEDPASPGVIKFKVTSDGDVAGASFTVGGNISTTNGLLWDNTLKRLGVLTTNPLSSLHVADTSQSSNRGLTTAQHSDSTHAGVIVLKKSRGTESIPTSVLLGDYILAFQAQAFDGSIYQNSASLNALVDGTPSVGSVPLALVFFTGTTTGNKSERMRINSSGNVGIGTTNATKMLDINGDGIRIRTSKTPATSSETCNQGEMAWDSLYVYVCVGTDTWKRAGLATW